jgi:hypothetical protein
MSAGKTWFKSILEHLTGSEFADDHDVRQFQCDPLGVWLDDGTPIPTGAIPAFYGRVSPEDGLAPGEKTEALFWGRATVEFTPEGEGIGWARVIDSSEPPSAIHVDWHMTTDPAGLLRSGQDRYGVSRGLIFKGEGEDGVRYIWRINGAT